MFNVFHWLVPIVLHLCSRRGITSRISKFDASVFLRPGDFPCLNTKAADTAHLLPIVLAICEEHSSGSTRDRMRICCLKSLHTLYGIFKNAGQVLSDDEHKSAVDMVDRFLQSYHWLAAYHLNRDEAVFNFVPKFHMIYHIADMAKWLNPRLVSCYGFESYIGKIKRSAIACLPGSTMVRIGSKVADNYAMVLHMLAERGWGGPG